MNHTSHQQPSNVTGSTSVAGVVAVEPAGPFVRVFCRTCQDVVFHDYPFKPFFLLADSTMLASSPVSATWQRLVGSGALCYLAETKTWHDWCQLRDHLQQKSNAESWFGISDICQQFLITSGIRFFYGLAPDDVRVLCMAVTTEGTGKQSGDIRITALSLADNSGYEEVVQTDTMAEPDILERLSRIIKKKDPDILTGYRLNSFDLPVIIRRAEHFGLRLGWGRDGTEPHLLPGTDRTGQQKNYAVYGRSVIDTVSLVRHYDRRVRPLPGTGLRQVAEWFGCTAQHEALILLGLYQRLAAPWYRQTQLYPVSFQSAITRPMAASVNALLIQEYLNQRHALPSPVIRPKKSEQSGHEFLQRGQAGPVAMCDLSALPVSIMLAYRIAPTGDDLNRFLPLLGLCERVCCQNESAEVSLRSFLLPAWFELLDGSSLLFADPVSAAEVKRLGRVITGDLLVWLKEQGAKPLSVDQQSICFVPAEGHDCREEIAELTRHLAELLPNGIDLQCGGQYQSIFVYSQNSYAMLEQDGTMVYRGRRVSSRSMEPYLLEFLQEALILLLKNRAEEVRGLYAHYLRRLTVHDCPVTWLMRTETLTDTPENYLQAVLAGKRNRAAVYELALSIADTWKIGDRISYYVTGNSKNIAAHDYCRFVADFDPAHPDLNIPWYAERLHQLFKRLEPFLPSDQLLF